MFIELKMAQAMPKHVFEKLSHIFFRFIIVLLLTRRYGTNTYYHLIQYMLKEILLYSFVRKKGYDP